MKHTATILLAATVTSITALHLQRYANDGASIGGELAVNTYTSANQHFPRVAMGLAGNFVVEWSSANQAGPGSGYDVYARLFSSCPTTDSSGPFVFPPASATLTQSLCQ